MMSGVGWGQSPPALLLACRPTLVAHRVLVWVPVVVQVQVRVVLQAVLVLAWVVLVGSEEGEEKWVAPCIRTPSQQQWEQWRRHPLESHRYLRCLCLCAAAVHHSLTPPPPTHRPRPHHTRPLQRLPRRVEAGQAQLEEAREGGPVVPQRSRLPPGVMSPPLS